MSDAALLFEEVGTPAANMIAQLRADGGVAVTFANDHGQTRVLDLEERGGYRAKFPHGDHGMEAVFINTGGGMLGGDRYRFDVRLGHHARATIASQSAERVYRTLGPATTTDVHLHLECGTMLNWLPQETILFDQCALKRNIRVDMAADARLLMVEAVVFGRTASGETIEDGAFRDRWRVSRAGRLIFADAISICGNVQATLQRPASGAGARAMATILYVAPDAEDCRDHARDALGAPSGRAAISAWSGMLTARFLAPDSATLRADLIRAVQYLARRPMPRVWNC